MTANGGVPNINEGAICGGAPWNMGIIGIGCIICGNGKKGAVGAKAQGIIVLWEGTVDMIGPTLEVAGGAEKPCDIAIRGSEA